MQLLADRASSYKGVIYLDKRDSSAKIEVGIPLRIHFRCDHSLLSVSNAVAYGNTVIHFKKNPDPGTIRWLSVTDHKWNKKNVCDYEVEKAVNLIRNLRKDRNPEDIFIISPFREVAQEITKKIKAENGLLQSPVDQIGTVHRFQGKEAPVVIFVLGGQTQGARAWAAQKPNLLNVAVTRAKNEFHVIGDLAEWGGLPHFDILADFVG